MSAKFRVLPVLGLDAFLLQLRFQWGWLMHLGFPGQHPRAILLFQGVIIAGLVGKLPLLRISRGVLSLEAL